MRKNKKRIQIDFLSVSTQRFIIVEIDQPVEH